MKQVINIFLNDKELVLSEPFQVNFMYILEELTNPTIVKNSYSKTFTVEGTKENNQIFNSVFNLDYFRQTGEVFNPSTKADFKIFLNGELYESGYAKLDSITRTGEKINYEISFFGGLGSFFYNLSVKEDGDSMTLADLGYGTDLTFKINRDTVKTAWDSLYAGADGKWSIINFMPSYSSVGDDFETGSILAYSNDEELPDVMTEDDKTALSNAGYGVFELAKDNYDWTELRDMRSYSQRPVLSVRSFFDAICDPDNNGGYEVNLDSTFFNNLNPYYADSWITLPQLNDSEETSESSSYRQTVGLRNVTNRISTDLYRYPFDVGLGMIDNDGTFYDTKNIIGGNVTAEVKFKIRLKSDKTTYYRFSPNQKNTMSYSIEGSKPTPPEVIFFKHTNYFVRLTVKNPGNETISQSTIYNFTGKEDYLTRDDYNLTYGWDNGGDELIYGGDFVWDSTDNCFYLWCNGTNVFTISHTFIPSEKEFRLQMDMQGAYKFEVGDGGFGTFTYNGGLSKMNCNVDLVYYGSMIVDAETNKLSYTNRTIRQEDILTTEFTPADYLLSYTKHFGLYYIKDTDRKRISILQRRNFYEDEVVDLSELIDYSKEMKIQPVPYEYKYFDFKLEAPDTELSKQYKSDYGRVYGSQRINTSYDFNSEVNDLYDGNAYAGYIDQRKMSNLYFKREYPFLIDGGTWKLTTVDGDELEKVVNPTGNVGLRAFDEAYAGYDAFPKVLFEDNDENTLVFFNGFKDCTGMGFNLTDDHPMMYAKFEKPCWIYNKKKDDYVLPVSSIPQFNRVKLSEGTIIKTWDFGKARELYVPEWRYSETPTVYDNYWSNFISDQYNSNAKIVECSVILEGIVLGDWLRRFYYFENSLWILLEILDYNICSEGSTRCRFLKVLDKANYLG